jgi:4-aminobutyrate aminotransferase-like enzyme
VLLGWTLHSDTLVRLAPPLTIPFEVLDEALAVILASLGDG